DVHAGDPAHQREILEGLMGRAVGFREEASQRTDQLDRKPRDADVGANELERAHRQERGQRVDDRHSAAQREAGGGPDARLLGDPEVEESRSEPAGQVPNGRPVLGGHHDDVRVALRDLGQPLFVRHRTIRVCDARTVSAPPCSSSINAVTSSLVNATNHRSARCSMLGRPLPRTVSATTTDGLPRSIGTQLKRRSIASKSWPSMRAVAQPNAANLASIGSSGTRSSVRTLAWNPLRSTMNTRLSSRRAAATSAASHTDPSFSSPSPMMTKTRFEPPDI